MSTEKKEVAKIEVSESQRFTNAVLKEYNKNAGKVELTHYQKGLINNYFIKLDSVLKTAEIKRMKKTEGQRDAVALTWKNVNMEKLAFDVVGFSSVGLDPLQPNHLNLIPYKNNDTGKYDITGIIGYRGCELKTQKYGLNAPDEIICELVFANDKFEMIKRDANNEIETYILQTPNPFDRGELVGGFYYHKHFSDPKRNKIRTFTVEEIEKRKPKYASSEFWGGEADEWKDGKKVGKVKVEGWYLEMCWKTLVRAGNNDITIDSEKIAAHIQQVLSNETNDYFRLIESETEDADHTVVSTTVASKKQALREKQADKTPTGDAPKTDATGQVNMM